MAARLRRRCLRTCASYLLRCDSWVARFLGCRVSGLPGFRVAGFPGFPDALAPTFCAGAPGSEPNGYIHQAQRRTFECVPEGRRIRLHQRSEAEARSSTGTPLRRVTLAPDLGIA